MSMGLIRVAIAGLFLPWVAQQTCCGEGPDRFRLDNPDLFPNSLTTALLSGPPVSPPMSFNWAMPTRDLPLASSPPLQKANTSPNSGKDLSDRLVDSLVNLDYATGEIGFLYGRSAGKFGGDLKQGYIIGEVGDDKFRISVGAAYEESSFRFPRSGR